MVPLSLFLLLMTTPRDNRAAARDERRHLQVPSISLGRADLIRSRSPSPSAVADHSAFNFPTTQTQPESNQFEDAPASTSADNMPDLSVDDIVKIATASAQAAAKELVAAAPPAATPDADTSNSNHCVKKVELPTFDKSNIHTWIRRVEAAFGRAGVVLPKDKFFFIESKIDVKINPKINEYLCGPSTEDTWDEFLQYLQDEYGRTKEQQAAMFLEGIPRDGLRPSQHLAKIKDLTKDIKLDELLKEMVLRDLPTSVRQSLAERSDLSADAAAKAADHYFNKEGRPKHKPPAAVNAVYESDAPPDLIDTDDESNGDVNAIRRQGRQRPRFTPAFSEPSNQRNNNGYKKPFQKSGTGSNRGQEPAPQSSQRSQQPKRPWTCKYHFQFGKDAKNCQPGCSQNMAPKDQAGRRA